MLLLFILIASCFLVLWLLRLNKDYCVLAFFAPRLKTANGEPVENIVATLSSTIIYRKIFAFTPLDPADVFTQLRMFAAELKRNYVAYIGGKTLLNVIDAEMAEMILKNDTLSTKGFPYGYLRFALGDGLIVSSGEKYHLRRKMLTPAFHFKILEQYGDIFREHSRLFMQKLKDWNTDVLVLNEVIPKFVLNILCETTMGIKLDKCLNGDQYYNNLRDLEHSMHRRLENPLLLADFIFNIFEIRKYQKALQMVHDFTGDVIRKRRELRANERQDQSQSNNLEFNEFGIKRKAKPMLDTLLLAQDEGLIDMNGICEEVNHFISAGIDTTSVVLMFSLMNLSLHADMQERCYQEIMENISDLDACDVSDISRCKYLDCFIKESMRMHFTTPSIVRKTLRETELPNGLILPANTSIIIHLIDIAHNPKYFESPAIFDPERFEARNSQGRHSMAYLPFSAGLRNCIGQKYAVLKVKTVLIHLIRNFKIEPLTEPSELVFEFGIGLRTKNDIKIRLIERN